MYRKDGCVSSPLIQYMCKSVQFSLHCLLVYTKAKLVGKRSPFIDKTRSYIKNHCILGIQVKEIINEISRVYGNNELSFLICHTVV